MRLTSAGIAVRKEASGLAVEAQVAEKKEDLLEVESWTVRDCAPTTVDRALEKSEWSNMDGQRSEYSIVSGQGLILARQWAKV